MYGQTEATARISYLKPEMIPYRLIPADYHPDSLLEIEIEIFYEELFKKEIDQIVVIIGGEDGSIVSYVKEKKDYISKLEEVVEDFYKMFELEYGKSG